MTDQNAENKASLKQLAQAWLSADNVSLLLGLALTTKAASMWSERAGWLTCGSLVLCLTVLHLIFGGRR